MRDEMTLRGRTLFASIAWLVLFASCDTRTLAQEQTALRPGVLWMFNLGVGQGYNDDALGNGQGGYFAQFDPQLSLGETTRHDSWSLNLQSSVQEFYNLSVADRFNENASMSDKWQISRRWTLDLGGNYLHSSDPLANSQETGEAQPVGSPSVVSPNTAFIGPQSPFSAFGGSSTIHYQAGRYSDLTFGGDYFSYRENSPQLPNTASQSFRVGYSRIVRRGQTIGVNYSAQFLTITNPGESVTTNTLLLTYGFEWKHGRQISLFGGPQYSSIGGGPASVSSELPFTVAAQQVLSYSVGATFSLPITRQNSFQLAASRRVSGSGGVSGAAVQDEADLGLSRRFKERFFASTGSFYSEYQALGNLPVAQPTSWGIFNRGQFSFTPNSSVSVEYDYFHQSLSNSSLGVLFPDNRALIEYHYSFGSLRRQR